MGTDGTNRRGVHIAGDAFEALDLAFRDQPTSDFGIDAHAEPRQGAVGSGQLLALQIKAGPSYSTEPAPGGWWLRTDQRHADYWLRHALPVLVVKVDVETKRIYWQAVTTDTVTVTGKGRKILIPEGQQVDSASLPYLLDLLTPIVPVGRYTVFREEDTSHGTAKRYSLDIVLKGKLSKAETASVVRAATAAAKQSKYHRNEIASAQWSHKEADVVWTFVYTSADDRAQTNWCCRSLWIRPDLDALAQPFGFDGENVGDDIVVDWKADCESLAGLLAEHTTDKHGFLTKVEPLAAVFETLLDRHGQRLDRLHRNELNLDSFLRDSSVDKLAIEDLYMASTDLPLPPFECSEVGKKLAELAALMHNMFLPHSERGLQTWTVKNGLWLAQQARKDATMTLGHLRYELSKVR